jgi:type VI protein secretion system component VasK
MIFARAISSITDRIREGVSNVAKRIGLWAVAGICLIVAFAFATAAGYRFLADVLSPAASAIIIAGVYVLIALIAIAAVSWSDSRTTAEKAADAERATRERLGEATAKVRSELRSTETMRSAVQAMAKRLGDSGYRKESVALLAANELMKQMTPLQFVGLVFLASFFTGRRLRS